MAARKRSSGPPEPDRPDIPAELRVLGADLDLSSGPFECVGVEHLDLARRDVTSLQLEQSRLRQVVLDLATLASARIQDVHVKGGSWANTLAIGTTLHRVEFEAVRMTGVNFAEAVLRDVRFVGCRIDLASFRFCRLERVRFEHCQLTESDFYGAKIDSVVFADSDLGRAILAEATFTGSEMRGCSVTGAVNPDRLRGVGMRWDDIVAAAGELARATGVHVIDESSE